MSLVIDSVEAVLLMVSLFYQQVSVGPERRTGQKQPVSTAILVATIT